MCSFNWSFFEQILPQLLNVTVFILGRVTKWYMVFFLCQKVVASQGYTITWLFSTWTGKMCFFKMLFCPKPLSQISHLKGFLFSCSVLICAFKLLYPQDFENISS